MGRRKYLYFGLILWFAGSAFLSCQSKGLSLPPAESSMSAWPQAGRTASGRAFLDQKLTPPLRLLWQRELDAPGIGGILFADDLALLLTTGPTFYAFDSRSGELRGKSGVVESVCGPPSLVGELLVYAELGKKPALHAIDLQTSQTVWSQSGTFCASVTARNDTLISASEEGKVSAFLASSGELLWSRSIGGRVRVGASLGKRLAFVGSGSGDLMALLIGNGEEAWSRQLDSGVRSRPAVATLKAVGEEGLSETIVITATAAGTVYGLTAESGAVRWQIALKGRLTPGMALTTSMLVVGSVDRHVYGLDPRTGELQWRFETGGIVKGSPAATAQTVYFGSADGYVYGLEVSSGQLLWKYKVDGPIVTPVSVGESKIAVTTEHKTAYVFGF